MLITRRRLQLSLALLWLLDGILQCQPFLVTRSFSSDILAPAGAGLPAVLAGAVREGARVVAAQPGLANLACALLQLALGLGLLFPRYLRCTLAASIVWALVVWTFGEGLGGLTTGATVATGAPGAALLYAVIAVLAWPSSHTSTPSRPSRLSLPAWCTVWLVAAMLQVVHGNNSASSVPMALRMAQSSAPGWIATLDRHVLLLRLPPWTGAAVTGSYVLVALWSLVPGWTRRLSLAAGTTIALASWLLFQGLGDFNSGQATDPNSGPLIVLLAVAAWGATRSPATDRGASSKASEEGARPVAFASGLGPRPVGEPVP